MKEEAAEETEDRSAEDGISLEQLRSVLCPPDTVVSRPASMQEETNLQAEKWSCEWGSSKTCIAEPEWPADMGEMPPRLLEDALVQAGLTFPRGLGLGWDGIHPRMLSRLSNFTQKWIVSILVQSEKSGKWDLAVGITIIVLLAKGDGTYRPTGLLPLLPKVWMRTRKIYATAWEGANDQSWVYAGVGKRS